jgi:PEP-CTERM motif
MTTRHSCGLVAAMTYLAVLSFPGSATAQLQEQSYQWHGLASYGAYANDNTTGDPVFDFNGTELATLSINLYLDGSEIVDADMTIAPLPSPFELSGSVSDSLFGPSGISGSLVEGIGLYGLAYGSFSSDLQTYAIANFYAKYIDYGDNLDITEFASFQGDLQSVPEPSTLTLAAIGVLAIWIFMRARRFLAPRKLRPGL